MTTQRATRITTTAQEEFHTAAKARAKLVALGWTENQVDRAAELIRPDVTFALAVKALQDERLVFERIDRALSTITVPDVALPPLSVVTPDDRRSIPEELDGLRVAIATAKRHAIFLAELTAKKPRADETLEKKESPVDRAIFLQRLTEFVRAARGPDAGSTDFEAGLMALVCDIDGAARGTRDSITRQMAKWRAAADRVLAEYPAQQ